MKQLCAKLLASLVLCALCLSGLGAAFSMHSTSAHAAGGSLYDPGAGKTLLLIGQEYLSELQGYVAATGQEPAGSSVYASMYTGQLNGSDDQQVVSHLAQNDPGSYVELGLSLTQATPQAPPQSANCGDPSTSLAAYYCYNYGYAAVYHAELDIVAGKFDTQIDAIANLMKSWPQLKFLLRIDYEVSQNGNANTNPYGLDPSTYDPSAYHNAFNYVAARIRNTDADSNVAFVFHPVRSPSDAQALYPGNAYVDWFGVSVFNNDVCLDAGTTSNCPGQSLDPNLAQVLQFGQRTGKPLMISESAVQTPSSQSVPGFETYLQRVFNLITTYDVHAFTYININWPNYGWTAPWGNSQLQQSSQVLNAWEQSISSSRYLTYNGKSGGGSTPTPTPPTPTPTSGGGIAIPGTLASNIGPVNNDQTLTYNVNAATSGTYQILVNVTATQNSSLLECFVDGQSIGKSAFDTGTETIGPPDFTLSAGSHTISVEVESSGVTVNAVTVNQME